MSQYYFGQTLQIRWRRWMTENYVSVWMAQGRHYRVRFVDPTIDNIHLRIANDVYLFIQRTHELGTGLLGSIVALVSFSYILWGLSADHAAAAVRRQPRVPRLSDRRGAALCRDRHADRALDRLAADPLQVQPAALRSRLPLRHRARRRPQRAGRADARRAGRARRARPPLRQPGAQLDRAGGAADQAHRLHRRLRPRLDAGADADRQPGLSRRRDPARHAGAGGAGVPARRGAASRSASAPTPRSRNGRRSSTACHQMEGAMARGRRAARVRQGRHRRGGGAGAGPRDRRPRRAAAGRRADRARAGAVGRRRASAC